MWKRAWFATIVLAGSMALSVSSAQAQEFDASGFEHPQFMSIIYGGAGVPKNKIVAFKWYVSSFVDELDNDRGCRGLIRSATKDAVTRAFLGTDIAGASMEASSPFGGRKPAGDDNILIVTDKGTRDADALIDRYSCASDVAVTIMHNIGVLYGVAR